MKIRPFALFLTYALMLFLLQTIAFSATVPAQDNQQNKFLNSAFHPCWNFESNNQTEHEIASDNESIFIPSLQGKLFSLELKSGSVLWQTQLGGTIISSPKVFGDKLYLITSAHDTNDEGRQETETTKNNISVLREIDTKTGITNWQKNIKARQNAHIFPTDADGLVVIDSVGYLTILDASTRSVLFEKDFDLQIVSHPHYQADNKTITFTTGSSIGKIISIQLPNGSVKYEAEIKSGRSKAHTSEKERVFWGDQSGNVYGLSSQNKLLWKTRFGAEISSIQTHQEGLLVTSHDNFAYLLDMKSGDLIWKRRLGGRIFANPVIKGDTALFATIGGSNLLVVEMKSGRVVNQIALPENFELINQPTLAGNLLILSGNKGIYAFSNAAECSKENSRPEK